MDPDERQRRLDKAKKLIEEVGRAFPGDPGYVRPGNTQPRVQPFLIGPAGIRGARSRFATPPTGFNVTLDYVVVIPWGGLSTAHEAVLGILATIAMKEGAWRAVRDSEFKRLLVHLPADVQENVESLLNVLVETDLVRRFDRNESAWIGPTERFAAMTHDGCDRAFFLFYRNGAPMDRALALPKK